MSELSLSKWLAKQILPANSDPRVEGYPLMGSWTPSALISLTYVVGVYAWRAEALKRCENERKNQSLSNATKNQKNSWSFVKCLMVMYNVIMVFFSLFLTLGTLWAVIKLGYGLGCEEQPDPNDRNSDFLAFVGYLFFISKFIEMLDTVFFLWRGKVDQVTFLHVFHHATMPPSVWWGVKYAPGGLVYMFPLANSFIHVIMYTYYGLAAAGAYRFLWWKNYLTLAQMIQFVILIAHQSQIFLISKPCNFPKVFPAAIIIYASVFLILFSNFYVKAYWHKQRLAKSVELKNQKFTKSKTIKQEIYHTNGHVIQNGSTIKSTSKYLSGEIKERTKKL